jgi:hypothetical protein
MPNRDFVNMSTRWVVMRSVFVSSKVKSRIELLKKTGKAGVALAKKANRIIENLTSGTVCRLMDTIGAAY